MTDAPLFADLPAPLADAIRELDATDREYSAKVGRIFESVAFPTDPTGVRAETLTAEQRAVAIALTELDLRGPLRSTTFPAHRAVRRRWLGLDPAGPLEQSTTFTIGDVTYVEPIWRMARIIAHMWNQVPLEDYRALRQRFDAQFTIEERLRLWGEVNATFPETWDLPTDSFFNYGEQPELIDQLHGEGAAWAVGYLDGILADPSHLGSSEHFVAFIALVRAGTPLDEKWDPIFTLYAASRHARELLLALPEPRRVAAALPALKRLHPSSALRVVIDVLPEVPSVALAEVALTCIPNTVGSPRKHRRALRDAAGTHAELLALLDAADAAAGPPLELTPTRERSIAEEGINAVFSELDKEQILVAGKRYLGGKGAPLEVLLAENPQGPDEERSLRAQLFYRAIADAKGKHVYDAWLYQTDSGTIFKAGTSRVAAEVVHFSVTCKDDRLAEALEEALRAEPAPVAEVPGPKKKTAKKAEKRS
jgi:hypothetical protein